MIRAAVIGASGYIGVETVRWLLGHPGFKLVAASSDTDAGKSLSALYPALLGHFHENCYGTDGATGTKNGTGLSADSSAIPTPVHDPLVLIRHEEALACQDIDVAFLAVPHTVALAMVPALLERDIPVIDLSADFRLKDAKVYEQWYQASHTASALLDHAVYGLCEINRAALHEKVAAWRSGSALPPLVANPGCYPTATALALAPAIAGNLLAPGTPVIVNAISGVSGAGRAATATTHFCNASDDLVAYGVASHRHTPEIAQTLTEIAGHELMVVFTPHLAPLRRGMIATVVVSLASEIAALGADEALALMKGAYADYYASEPFVTLLPIGTMPHSASVAGTNNVQVGIAYDARSNSLIASCAIDNLGKGAASQAVQNANIIFGFAEVTGLDTQAAIV